VILHYQTKKKKMNSFLYAYRIDWLIFWFYAVLAIFQQYYSDWVTSVSFESFSCPDGPQLTYSISKIRETIFACQGDCDPRHGAPFNVLSTDFIFPTGLLRSMTVRYAISFYSNLRSLYIPLVCQNRYTSDFICGFTLRRRSRNFSWRGCYNSLENFPPHHHAGTSCQAGEKKRGIVTPLPISKFLFSYFLWKLQVGEINGLTRTPQTYQR
jgi:hypothetical protein